MGIAAHRPIVIAAMCFALLLGQAGARADEQRYAIDISSSNAADALNQLAKQTEHPLLFDYEQMKVVQANSLSGYYTLQQALDLLLVNTGFTGKLVDQRVISIARIASPTTIVATPKPEIDRRNKLIDEVLVTGTNIRGRTQFTSGAPVQVLNKTDIRRAGVQDLTDVASLLTVNSGSIVSQETGDLIGTSQFNVRGLGFGSTLVLINGRRVGVSAVSNSSGVLFYDVKQLPLTMIERIDVQTDGASSIYGSDAVGGVVNIITRKGFEGVEISARYQDASNQAAAISLASGVKTRKARVNLYATAYTQTRNHRTDFDWLVERIHGNGDLTQSRLVSSLGSPGSYRRASVTGTPSIDPSTATIIEVGARFADPDCLAANGVLVRGRCGYDFADQVAPIPEENRLQVFSELEYDVHAGLSLFAEASLSRNAVQRTQGPSSFRNGLVSGGDLFVPSDHPFNFWIDDPDNPGSNLIYVDPLAWDNSVNTAVDLVCECRPLGFEANGFNNNPPFNQDIDLNYLRGLVGLDWAISDRWQLRANYIYSRSKRNFSGENNWNAVRLNSAVLDGTFNPFGTSRVNPNLVSPKDGISTAINSAATIAFIQNVQRASSRSLQEVIDITASGDVFSNRYGTAAAAIGGQLRRVDHRAVPDALTAAGLGNNPNRSTGINDSQDVAALFGEVAIPVADDVEVQLALRHENYSGPLSSTTDPKIAARWDVSDKVSLSGSWGTAFRGPSIPQVGRSSGTAFIDDPVTPGIDSAPPSCGGTGQSNIAIIRTEGSDSLRPESSKNLNLSALFKPLDHLNVRIDYWRFDYSALITADEGPQAIVENDCNDDGIPNDPRVSRTSDGQLLLITTEFINTGSVVTDGVDLAASYRLPSSAFGEFSVSGTLSYVDDFRVTDFDGNRFQGAGSRNFTNQFGSLPRLKANAAINWQTDKYAINLGLRYIGDYENDQNPGFTVDHWVAVDLQYSVDINLVENRKTSLLLGARNLLGADPPSLGPGQRPAYDDRVHDIRGRAIYLDFRHQM